MSVGSQTFPPGGPNGILRSQSFAGFSGIPERRSRCNSFLGNSSVPKKPQAKQKKMHNLGHKNNSSSKEPQPERVEEIYSSLKNGLDEYLEVHQTELDKLTAQLKDMKRNSRLGVLYDLDKQIKTIERYIRRLEFHMSKVDELYEAYCIQKRLREGACKMKQAFAASPSSRAARESLSEINKSFKEYTENMCTVESEMENLLGEFCIKMKGLAGFARLCPGDQYEVNSCNVIKMLLCCSPFDTEDLTPSTGNINKAAALQRRVSIYSQGTPETPTFKEHSFFSNLQDDVFDGAVEEKRALSLSFDDLPNGECTPPRSTPSSSLGYSNPEITCKPSVNRSRSSSISLTVESALESFDFLNTSDFDDDDVDEDGGGMVCNGGGADSVFADTIVEKTSYRSEHPEARGHLSEALTEDTGVGTSVASSPLPLTTGNESLDITLTRHLQYCSELIKQIITSSEVLFVLRDLNKKLSRQSQVIKQLSELSKENTGNTSSLVEVISGFHDMPSLLSFWTKCSTSVHIYHISADKMVKQLHESFSHMVITESPGLIDAVYRTLVAHILDKTENLLSSNLSAETITVFQYYDFFTSHNITDLKSYLTHLAKEASAEPVLQTSVSSGKMTDLEACNLSPSQEILTSSSLLLSENAYDVSQALDLLSSTASKSKEFREKVGSEKCRQLTK
ncbi:hypothetical protein GDO78_012699, partial [Eleutherodactylus coqui]